MQTKTGWLVWAWGVGGTAAFLLSPVIRLATGPVMELRDGLTATQAAVALVWAGFMVYAEGWRGFHKQFSPRVVARAIALGNAPKPLPALLAPLTCMGLLHATRKRKIVSWSLLFGITLLVLGVRQLPAPWRGIVDVGVVLGLSIGLLSIGWFALQTLLGNPPQVPTDMPRTDPT